MEVKKYSAIIEILEEIPPDADEDPGPDLPEPEPPLVEEGYLVLEGPVPAGPDTFHVNIVGGTNAQVDGYSMAVGYPGALQVLGFTPGKFVREYVGEDPFKQFHAHLEGEAGAVPSQHVALMCGFWTSSNPSGPPPVTIPAGTLLGFLTFKWQVPGRYQLDNATKKYGKRPLISMFTRLTGPYIAPELGSLTVSVPIS